MGLQLKGGNVVDTNEDFNKESQNLSAGGETRKALDRKNVDPWGNKDIEDNFYNVNYKAMKEESRKEYGRSLKKVLKFTLIIVVLVLAGVAFFVGRKYYLAAQAEKGRDLFKFVNSKESVITEELGITLTDSKELINDTLAWRTDKKLEVHSNEDVAIIYLDGRQTGLNVHSEQYKLFGVQVGMGDKEALKATTYECNEKDYYVNSQDMDEGKTTTTYYYNKEQNDCLGLTVNKMTNTVQGITYIDNYQVFVAGHDKK